MAFSNDHNAEQDSSGYTDPPVILVNDLEVVTFETQDDQLASENNPENCIGLNNLISEVFIIHITQTFWAKIFH